MARTEAGSLATTAVVGSVGLKGRACGLGQAYRGEYAVATLLGRPSGPSQSPMLLKRHDFGGYNITRTNFLKRRINHHR